MREQKVRGHTKIWKQIENWIKINKDLDLEYLKSYQRNYTKVWVQPYSNLCMLNSVIPPPKGKTRQKIVAGLFEIYEHWKKQLDTLDEP